MQPAAPGSRRGTGHRRRAAALETPRGAGAETPREAVGTRETPREAVQAGAEAETEKEGSALGGVSRLSTEAAVDIGGGRHAPPELLSSARSTLHDVPAQPFVDRMSFMSDVLPLNERIHVFSES